MAIVAFRADYLKYGEKERWAI